MGIMKRLDGWRRYYPPLPQPLRAFAGLEPHRDPEAFLERKRAEREAAAERRAIQEEGRGTPQRRNASPPAECVPEPDPDRPQLAAAGWYRAGQTFYRIGSGPHPGFYAVRDRPQDTERKPARLQLSLFD